MADTKNSQSPWDILYELAGESESELRRLLCPHWERQTGEEGSLLVRLDKALDELTLLEVEGQTGVVAADRILGDADVARLAKLFQSEAFARYVNSYLYFGIRFLANRILGKADLSVADADCNARPRALPTPPPPDPHADPQKVQDFLGMQTSSPPSKEVFSLIDGRNWNAHVSSEEHIPAPPTEQRRPPDKECYSLWLRGLLQDAKEAGYEAASGKLIAWMERRVAFYQEFFVEPSSRHWIAVYPLCARFGLADFYWLSKLLGAEVSSNGTSKVTSRPWIRDILTHAGRQPREVRKFEQILRGVFDYTCDLIQNASEIRDKEFLEQNDSESKLRRPEGVVGWRFVVDEEMAEIDRQRRERKFTDVVGRPTGPPPADENADEATDRRRNDGWSDRFFSKKKAPEPIGIAISGGGIRSATFALGVLQGLKGLDLLRHVDYLSTVSGGGFVGSWLVGNVRRTPYWLSKLSNWEESIAHLRRFSNYLSPKTGLMSADYWTMWGTWIRNAFLVQLTAFAWLAAGVTLVRLLEFVFAATESPYVANGYMVALLACIACLAISVCKNLHQAASESWVLGTAVAPAWIGAFVTASLLWNQATLGNLHESLQYSAILMNAWKPDSWGIFLAVLAVCFFLIGVASVRRDGVARSSGATASPLRWPLVIFGAALTTGLLYMQLCALVLFFQSTLTFKDVSSEAAVWIAYVFGAALTLIAVTNSIVIQIGVSGNLSQDGIREWWTRFGAWLGIVGVVCLAAGLASIFGPRLVFWVASLDATKWKWGAVLSWLGTVAGGLMAGNSGATKGDGDGAKKKAIDLAAQIAGFAFIVGSVLMGSALVHVCLTKIWTDPSKGVPWSYWDQLSLLKEAELGKWPRLEGQWQELALSFIVLLACALFFSWRFDLNTFGLNFFYRNRLVRCYLGATRWRAGWRKPNKFTGFDDDDDLEMTELVSAKEYDGIPFRGPFPIVNCSLNLGGSSDLALHTRQSASFLLTPLRCGSDRLKIGYERAKKFAKGVRLGEAVSISGAAASPNMGYNTSPLASFLLTLFNVRLGWWFPNPGQKGWQFSSFVLLFKELFGLAGEDSGYINVSDGGHFENLAIYELIRRRAKIIIASDAECDPDLTFGSLGNLIRICETDFGAKIELNVDSLRRRKETGKSAAHCAVGIITYCNGGRGFLIYLKASLAGEEDVAIQQYHAGHPDFPHESTGDQFFSEDQFESYRRLGRHVVERAFRGTSGAPVQIARQLFDIWAAEGAGASVFVKHSERLDRIWERLRTSATLTPLAAELLGTATTPPPPMSDELILACSELLQLMEDVFLELRLDDFWDLPDNRGWTSLFIQWAKSPTFRAVWPKVRDTYGIRFEYFCARRLGLPQA